MPPRLLRLPIPPKGPQTVARVELLVGGNHVVVGLGEEVEVVPGARGGDLGLLRVAGGEVGLVAEFLLVHQGGGDEGLVVEADRPCPFVAVVVNFGLGGDVVGGEEGGVVRADGASDVVLDESVVWGGGGGEVQRKEE